MARQVVSKNSNLNRFPKGKLLQGRIHKGYFPIVQASSPTDFMMLMAYLDNLNICKFNRTTKCNVTHGLACWIHAWGEVERSNVIQIIVVLLRYKLCE